MWNLFTVLILFWVSLSIKRHDVAENPNPYYPTPTNVLLEGVHTYMSISRKRDANVDPRWAEKSEGKRPRTRRRKLIGDESPPWTIQRPLRSTLEVRFVDDKLCLKKCSGYAHEDACKFLDEYNSYCVFHDMNTYPGNPNYRNDCIYQNNTWNYRNDTTIYRNDTY